MIPAANLLAFVAAATLIVVVPGPGVLFTIGRALTLGRRAALISVLGHALGVQVALLFVAVGLGAVLTASATAMAVVKLAGALYLIHLGIQAFRERRALAEVLGAGASAAAGGKVFRQSMVVGVTNPKAIVFFAAVLPHFTDPAAGSLTAQLLLLGSIFLVIALICDSVWALLAVSARGWFARSPRRLAAVGGAGGIVIAGLGGSVAVEQGLAAR